MDTSVIFIMAILACAAAGALGYHLGRKQGLMEGTLNGAMTVLTQSERFIRFASVVAHGAAEDLEDEDYEDEE